MPQSELCFWINEATEYLKETMTLRKQIDQLPQYHRELAFVPQSRHGSLHARYVTVMIGTPDIHKVFRATLRMVLRNRTFKLI